MSADSIHGLVDHLFRHEAGRMVASLTRSFGPAHLGLAEEVVQEALIQALRRWPFHGIPDKPGAWLYRVARNLALDRLRRDATFRDKEGSIRRTLQHTSQLDSPPAHLHHEVSDDQLRLIFLCCHPEVPLDARVALTLKTVGGFSVPEIARAFLAQPTTVAQRLVRAQRRIRERRLPFELPAGGELESRLDSVLEVLYLMFNEGYTTSDGDELVRSDLCAESLRLAEHLASLPITARPAVHALYALLLFQASRLPARVDEKGNLVRLPYQDRRLWHRGLVQKAFEELQRATTGDQQSLYHLQAAIAAHHALATGDEDTNWRSILGLYDRLHAINPSPIVALNRAVAVARVRGSRPGLEALREIEGHPAVRKYYLLPAIRAELHTELGELDAAAAAYRRALACPCSAPERRFLEDQLRALDPNTVQAAGP